jgi:hypothetical protein
MQESFHGETHDWPSGWEAAFQEVRDLFQQQLAGTSLGQYDCLDQGQWLDDDIMQLFIDCLERGIPEPQTDATHNVVWTFTDTTTWCGSSQIRSGGNGLLLDLSEVCIVDPQNTKNIQLTFETSDYTACLKMLKKNCKFHTANRILLPFNTSGCRIVTQSDTHWMLVELDLTTDEVHIYDWQTGIQLENYDKIMGRSVKGLTTNAGHTSVCVAHCCFFSL